MSTPADQPVPHGHDANVAARVEVLYEEHAGLVRTICRSLLRDRVETEDAVQQTFLSAQRALANGSSPRDAVAWLATIARNECLARVRARMREPLPVEVEEHGEAPDAYAVAAHRHDAGQLRDALADLPRQQREAILLREVRGYSYQEVAAALSVTTSAAESLLFRARRSLQLRLQQALAAFSPAAWLQMLRELAAPAAAKIAAAGAGAAVMTSGALVAPMVLGLGHSPRAVLRTSKPPTPHVSHAVPPRPRVSTPLTFASPAVRHVSAEHAHQADRTETRGSAAKSDERGSVSQPERSDTPTQEREPSGETSSPVGSDATGDPSPTTTTSSETTTTTDDSASSTTPTTTTDPTTTTND